MCDNDVADSGPEEEEPGVTLPAPDLAAAAAAAAQVLWDETLATAAAEGPADFAVNPGKVRRRKI